ncbi:hypothetical protein FOL46_003473, partial [Perkinsus olseni]
MASSSSSVGQLSEGLQHSTVVNSEKDSDAVITRDGNPSIIINVPSSKSSAMESQEAMDNYKNNPKRPGNYKVFDRQRAMQGSSAGFGSDFFGWDKMQKVIITADAAALWGMTSSHAVADLEYHRKREEHIKKDIERTEKRRARRMKRKQNRQKKSKQPAAAAAASGGAAASSIPPSQG